jgi:hypothetical protein
MAFIKGFTYKIQGQTVFISDSGKQDLELRIQLCWDVTPYQWAMESQRFKDTTFP